MADNSVFITGIAEGAFGEVFRDLPPWATEETALDIEKILKKSFDVQQKTLSALIKNFGKGAGSGNAEEMKKANDELDKFIRNMRRGNEEDAKRRRIQKEDDKEDKERLKRKKDAKKDEGLFNKFLAATASLGVGVLDVQKQYFQTSEQLFKSGVNLISGNEGATSSMAALNSMISLTGLRLETLQKAVEKNAASINAVGVGKFAKTISQSSAQLIALGYSSEQQAELIGTLIDSESNYVDIRNKSSESLARDAVRLGAKLTQLSLLTGQSAEKLQENLKAMSKSTDSTVVAARFGDEAAKRMNLFAASFADADIGALFQKLAASQAPQITGVFQTLAKAGEGVLAQELTRIAQGARDGVISAAEANKQATRLAQGVSSATLSRLQLFADAGDDSARQALESITKLRTQGNKTSQANQKQTDAAIRSQASLSAFSTQLERSRSLMQVAFPLLETQVNLATAALAKFNSTMLSGINAVDVTTRAWIAAGLAIIGAVASIGVLKNTFSILIDVLQVGGRLITGVFGFVARSLTSLLGTVAGSIAAVVAAFAVGYTVGTYLSEMLSKFDWFNNAMDTIFAGLDHVLKYIPGLSSDAKERISTREKLAAQATKPPGSAKPAKVEVSVPKDPVRSTIASPSAVGPEPKKEIAEAISTPEVSAAMAGLGIDKPAQSSDINSILTYQGTLLEQILVGTNNLVSVNKDILRYSKIQS